MTRVAPLVGEKIRALREERGWTQDAVAKQLGKTQTAVSYWESGQRMPGIDDLLDLARVFGVAPATILPHPEVDTPP